MAGEKIEIVIDEEGNASVEAFGYKGGKCREATGAIEKALGSVSKRKVKGDDCRVIDDTVKAGR